MLGFYEIPRLGRPPKDSKSANTPIDKNKKNVDKPVQKKKIYKEGGLVKR